MLTYNGKRRNSDLENEDYNVDENGMDTSSFKRLRVEAPTPSIPQNSFPQQNFSNEAFTAQYFQDAQINAFRAQYEQELAQLDAEIERVSKESAELSRQCEEATNENKILKRGIQIQESKLKEATQHQEQLTQMIQHAIVNINGLEKANQELFAEIELYKNGKKRPEDDYEDMFHDCSRF
jgi:chromosome segregation ATPase